VASRYVGGDGASDCDEECDREGTSLRRSRWGRVRDRALSGWWAVAVVVFVVMLVTYVVVCWLAANTRAGRISTFLITWEAPSEREPEASPPKRQKVRSDAA